MSDPLDRAIFGEELAAEGEHEHSVRRRQARQRPPRRSGRKILTLLLALVLVGGAGVAAVTVLKPLFSSIGGSGGDSTDVDFAGPGEGAVKIVVAEGQTGEDIATTLRDNGVTKTRTAYLDAAKGDPAAASAIQPGTYTLKKGMTGVGAFKFLINPANAARNGTTIREGLWASEIYTKLSEATGVPVADYEAAAKDAAAIGLPAEAGGNVEGWLFPSTYQFPDQATAVQQLSMMVKMTVTQLASAGVPMAEAEKTLILASIIEAEAKGEADRGKVAQVLLNRVANTGAPSYGLLQLDSTVSYGIKQRTVTTTDAARADKNPWNTYVRPGLPVGPISNPGMASIKAAMNPTPGPWMFFVAVNPITGETKFATTLAEHDRYVKEFQAFCQANKGTC